MDLKSTGSPISALWRQSRQKPVIQTSAEATRCDRALVAAILASGHDRGAEHRRRLAWVHLAAHAQHCGSALRAGPQIVWWRLSLLSAFLTGYLRQTLTARGH